MSATSFNKIIINQMGCASSAESDINVIPIQNSAPIP